MSGKHGTSFCMIGQTAIANKEGYWKDKCIDLDFELLTKEFGIPEDEISFVESVWVGRGRVRLLARVLREGAWSSGNAVFTAFEGDPANYTEMGEKVVDMGAGLERLSWMTQGTPTYYDTAFAPVLAQMKEQCEIHYDEELFERYSRLAGAMNLDEYPTLADARKVIAKSLNVEPEAHLEAARPHRGACTP